jgi:glycosyltransferase involved in cell wall biosynthesis
MIQTLPEAAVASVSPPRITVLIFEPYPMGQGGGNLRTLFYILRFLDRARFEPIVVTPIEGEFVNRFREKGVEVAVVNAPASIARYGGRVLREGLLGRLRSVADLVIYNLRIARFIRDRRVDVVYCNSIRALLTVGFAARLTSRPVLWYIKGTLENGLLDRLGFVMASRILFFCEANRDDKYPGFVRWFRRKLGILKIGIDPAIIADVEQRDTSALERDLGIDRGRINIIILGQVYRPKGVHAVLERFKELVEAHPAVVLWIVGDHVLDEFRSYKDELDAIVSRDGLADHVRFTGWRTDALEILTLMDIVVHPSLAEGFGRAVLESMALGKAVVASRVGGLREIIRDGENGYLVDPGDSATFLDRLKRLAGDPALRARFGRKARREVFAGHLIEDKMQRLQDIWAEMAR